ncbi:4383_t:CDS:2 [Ambispora gerdemannii]|uniref:4383_t:CDS:1 n=1 Tax=Ambispora gerdemannii TaxID=144530 RepID=A0A9N9AZM0_9GLOM|nr:4383_t:CDS:2 [Ambispora gerdemannii]
METDTLNNNATGISPDTPITRSPSDDPYMTSGAVTYTILCTISLILMCILTIIYGRLSYNRVFVYFCVSIIALFIPHTLGAWIFGANLARAPDWLCWIQGLWINAAGIGAGLTVLLYSFEIYKSIVLHIDNDYHLLKKYYLALAVLVPLLIGFIGPVIVAEKPHGVLPGPYFCILYRPILPLAFVSIQGWNTLFSIPGIYFSFRTVIEVIKVIYTQKGFDDKALAKERNGPKTNSANTNISHDIESAFTMPYTPTTMTSTANTSQIIQSPTTYVNHDTYDANYTLPDRTSKLSDRTISSIPVYVCLRLVLFGLLYCAVTISVYGRNLYHSVRQKEYDFKPTYLEYVIASLGIINFLVFGTSREAGRAYLRFIMIAIELNWLRRCFAWMRRDESFGDWEIQQEKKRAEEKAKQEKKFKEMQQKQKRRKNQHQRDDSRANVLNNTMEIDDDETD